MRTRWYFLLLFAALLAARLCHSGVLWAEEDLPMAAARQILLGKMLYRDVWFDKPPLLPSLYLLWGAQYGWVLRVAGSVYALLACLVTYLFARDLWSEREGRWAAGLLAFFLIFDTPAAVIPLAADLSMLVPHVAAVYLAWKKRPFASGIAAGMAFLFNSKAAFVLGAAAVFVFPALPFLAVGFVVPNLVAFAWMWHTGSLQPYIEQVWVWGAQYAGSTFVSDPVRNGIVRTLNWLGFHAALVIAMVIFRIRERRWIWWKFGVWMMLSFAAVTMGWRFFPRYYFQVLPILVILAARGVVLSGPRVRALIALALLVPLIRFGPRYPMLAFHLGREWSDTAMDRDSREAAGIARSLAGAGDTLFVWGFRPDLFVYTGLRAGTRFIDCQALTGVPADRHLTQSQPVVTEASKAARAELERTRPTLIIDGLSLYNPRLAMQNYPELRAWLANYREAARTGTSIIYQLLPSPAGATLPQKR